MCLVSSKSKKMVKVVWGSECRAAEGQKGTYGDRQVRGAEVSLGL